MPGYMLDTNHLGVAVSRVSTVRERIYQLHRTGVRIGTCVPVLCELEVGIQQTSRPDSRRHILKTLFERALRLWPIDLKHARLYGEIYLELSRRGRTLSQVDMMLAALAKSMSLTLLTTNRDFEALPDIRTENWLA